ncbi:MAG: hypothetical protein CBC05_02700 [Crocinitomicaceae bacterium TMED45]|nr:MAG: hypothetical protein CBC05_02700 [Crocinitomicaceae bacterium TMED45]|tara:strand:- start:1156 stop:1341 length:186 start_codon:yes stop_codon:yes gene_type:complete
MDEFTGYVKIYLVEGTDVSWKYFGKISKRQSWNLFKELKEDYDCIVFYDISKQEFLENIRE